MSWLPGRQILTIGALTLGATLALLLGATGPAEGGGEPAASFNQSQLQPETVPDTPPDFELQLRQQAETDEAWRRASAGHMRMEKITYRSSVGDLDIPAFVFHPLTIRGAREHPALVWVHEDIRGRVYEHYIPYVREATARGYVVIAPEYRGSVGYGKAFYDAIDYGGAEVDDVVTAASVLADDYGHVDPERIGIIGWSHGGLIAMMASFRNTTTFRSVAAIVPVANLLDRVLWKGVDRQRRAIDPHNRFGGSPIERPDVYRERSPVFHVDRLEIPLLVHLASNDRDVTIDEGMQLVNALRLRKPHLADTKVYASPIGGHLFDRRVEPGSWRPANTPEQRDSWERVWAFFGNNLSRFRQSN
jgi:dipeptidyl aminopeptidase/acylaminoacyl peptidase